MNREKQLLRAARRVATPASAFMVVAATAIVCFRPDLTSASGADAVLLDGTSRAGVVNEIRVSGGGAPATGPIVDAVNDNHSGVPVDGTESFSRSVGGPLTHPRYSGYTSTLRSSMNVSTVLDAEGNLRSISGSASAEAAASQPNQLTPLPGFFATSSRAGGSGESSFQRSFLITRSGYDYLLTAAAGASSSSADPSHAQVQARGLVSLSGPGGVLFISEQQQNGFGGNVLVQNGSLAGPLAPGQYLLNGAADASGRVTNGPDRISQASVLANASASWNLNLIAPIFWTNAASGDFQTSGNWSSGAPPSGVDNATIDLAGAYTVSLGGNAEHKRLHVTGDGANVTLDLAGFRYRLDELHLGDPSGNFSFTLSDSSGIAAAPPGDNGPWPAPGFGEARWAIRANQPGRAEITAKTISPEGLIDVDFLLNVHGDGDWTVDRLIVGDQRAGTLTVSGGGKVQGASAIIGKQVRGIGSGVGKAVVSGGGGLTSKFDPVVLVVGDDGKGELEIKSGGEVSAADIEVGNTLNGEGVVNVDGQTARLHQDHDLGRLVIGLEGKGTLNVLNNASVAALGTLSIGGNAGENSDGSVNVTHDGIIQAKSLIVGNSGKGTLNVLDDGAVAADRTIIGPKGKVTVANGGGLSLAKTLTVNGELSVNITGGALVSTAIAAIPLGKLVIGPGGTLKGNGIIRGHVDFAGGSPGFSGSLFAPANSTGTLTIEGDVVQAAGSAMEIEIGGNSAGQFDVLKVIGNTTLGGDVFLKFTDGFAPEQGQQFEFLDVSGTLSGAFANVHLRNLAPGFQFDLSQNGDGMTMVALNDGVFMLPQSSAWNVDASGNWASVANWTDGDPNHAGGTAVLGATITAPRTVTVDAPITVGRIDFDNSNAYTVEGDSTLTLGATSGDAQINVTSGSHTISAPVSLADHTFITVSPAAGNLTISGALSATDVSLTKAGAGTLTVNNLRAAGLSINAGTVAMAPHAASSQPSTSVLGTLSIAGEATPTATLDLNNNAAILDYTETSSAATVRAQILAGRGGAGLGQVWDGMGITSSAVAAANAADAEARSIGYAENSALPLGALATFHGQAVDDTSVLIAFTRTGDANLDGLVNDDDVTIVSATYAPGVPQPSWALGDFDYNGFVDDDDVTLLGVFYDPSAAPLVSGGAVSGEGVAAVPEPATGLLMVLATLSALGFVDFLRKPPAIPAP